MPTAIAARQYAGAPRHLMNGDVPFLTGNVKALLAQTYTFTQTHDTLADVVASAGYAEATTTTSGYTARGQALTGKTITTAGLVTTVDAADLTWTTPNPGQLSAQHVIYYLDSGTNATSWLLGWNDLGSAQVASNGGTWSWAIPGIATYTVATTG
jgi:hypothetical protein